MAAMNIGSGTILGRSLVRVSAITGVFPRNFPRDFLLDFRENLSLLKNKNTSSKSNSKKFCVSEKVFFSREKGTHAKLSDQRRCWLRLLGFLSYSSRPSFDVHLSKESHFFREAANVLNGLSEKAPAFTGKSDTNPLASQCSRWI